MRKIALSLLLLVSLKSVTTGEIKHDLRFRPLVGQEIHGFTEVVTRTTLNGMAMNPIYTSTCSHHVVLSGTTSVRVEQRTFTMMKEMSCCGSDSGPCNRDSLMARFKPARKDTFLVEVSQEASLSSKIKKPTPYGQHPSMAFVAPATPVTLGESWTFNHASTLNDSATSTITSDSTQIRYTLEKIIDSAGVSYAMVSARITHHLSVNKGTTIITYTGEGSAEYKVDLATGILHHAEGSIKKKGAVIGERATKQFMMNTELEESYRLCLLGT
ncbi:MAG TPA: hypothetical protein VK147_06070 [Candidatus Didemnitutus sp.]|nr:hypothetical protein [Candidatus Didemnitutus sp.]